MSDDEQIYELRDDIEETRDNLSETISQLEERLAPQRLQQDTTEIVREVADKIIAEFQGKSGDLTQQIADQVQAAVHGAAMAKSDEYLNQAVSSLRSVGTSLWERIGQSPAPAALAAVGIGLLAAGSGKAASSAPANGSSDSVQSGSGVMSTVDQLLAKVNTVADQATGALSNASQSSANLLDQAKEKVSSRPETTGQVRGLVSDQPLVAGLMALGLGAAMGISMPGTAKERDATSTLRTQTQDKLGEMGIASNPQGMMDQAKDALGTLAGTVSEAATSGLGQAKHAASEMASTAKETAASAANDRGLTH